MNHEIKMALLRTLPFLVVVIVFIILVKRKKINTHDLMLCRPDTMGRFVYWIIGFLLFIVIIEWGLYKFNLLEIDKWQHGFIPSLILIPGAVLLAPIAEELIFRGMILNALVKRKLSVHLAIFLQAIFFVLLHNFTWQNTLSSNIGVVQSLIDATLFGYARYSTKSIYTPMAMHITGNMIAVLERFIF